MSTTGLAAMLKIHWRTGRVAYLWWLVGVVGLFGITVASLVPTYDTPESLNKYAQTVGSDPNMAIMTGKIAGLNTLGGVIANEFSFLACIMVPLMGIALVSRATRKDEEAGRWELLLAAKIGRQAPLVSAVLLALGALFLSAVLIGATTQFAGADPTGAWLYAAAMGLVGAVFVGVATIVAQLFAHSRAVLGAGFAVIIAAFAVRGIAATHDSPLVWLSPLGLADEVKPFGESNAIPILVLTMVAALLIQAGFSLATVRDLDAAFVPARPGSPTANALLRTAIGVAIHEHRGTIIGWTLGVLTLMAMYGSLSQTILDAIAEQPELKEFFAASGGTSMLEPVMGSFLMMLAIMTTAYGIAALGVLKSAESSGRLEPTLARPTSRLGWLAVQLAVILTGVLIIFGLGAVTLATTAEQSINQAGFAETVLSAAFVYLPSVLAVMSVGVFLFGLRPRAQGLTWAVFGASAVLAYMGPMLKLPDALSENSPFVAAGMAPAKDPNTLAIGIILAVLLTLLISGAALFRNRDVPNC